jgi:flagellar protein FliL
MLSVLPDLDNDLSAFDEEPDKVALDRGKLPEEVPKSARKVELDLDDAPFLDFDQTGAVEPASGDKKKPSDRKEASQEQEQALPETEVISKRPSLALLASAVVAVLLMATAVIYLLLPAAAPEPPISRDIPHLVSFEPFYIEQQGADGLRFLQCRFAFPAGSAEVERELLTNRLLIRDGLFFYLTRREPAFLTQEEETVSLKRDLLTVINQYLTTGRLDEVLIDEYVIR